MFGFYNDGANPIGYCNKHGLYIGKEGNIPVFPPKGTPVGWFQVEREKTAIVGGKAILLGKATPQTPRVTICEFTNRSPIATKKTVTEWRLYNRTESKTVVEEKHNPFPIEWVTALGEIKNGYRAITPFQWVPTDSVGIKSEPTLKNGSFLDADWITESWTVEYESGIEFGGNYTDGNTVETVCCTDPTIKRGKVVASESREFVPNIEGIQPVDHLAYQGHYNATANAWVKAGMMKASTTVSQWPIYEVPWNGTTVRVIKTPDGWKLG